MLVLSKRKRLKGMMAAPFMCLYAITVQKTSERRGTWGSVPDEFPVKGGVIWRGGERERGRAVCGGTMRS